MSVIRMTTITTALAVAAICVSGAPDRASAQILRGAAGNPGATSHSTMTVFSKIANRETGASIQVNDNQTLSKTTLQLGLGKLDITLTVPTIYQFMTKGTRMYRKVSKQAKAASGNVRGVFGWLANYFHPVVFENVPIKKWTDIKGKRVFTGPPSGAAAVNSEMIIRIITGYVANKDYRAIRLNWGSGLQAMMDGQLDVYIRPVPIGAAMIEQLGVSRKFRLLSVPDDVVSTPAWKRYEKIPGRLTGVIPANTYRGQIGDKDSTVGAATMLMVVRKGLDDDLVYRMTKAFWTNLDEVHATVHVLKSIKRETPFTSLNAPLHKGALRYYKEAGITVPAMLVPPEAR